MDDQTKNLIENHIESNDVCLFMKGTPDEPQCGFSMAVSNILKILEKIASIQPALSGHLMVLCLSLANKA